MNNGNGFYSIAVQFPYTAVNVIVNKVEHRGSVCFFHIVFVLFNGFQHCFSICVCCVFQCLARAVQSVCEYAVLAVNIPVVVVVCINVCLCDTAAADMGIQCIHRHCPAQELVTAGTYRTYYRQVFSVFKDTHKTCDTAFNLAFKEDSCFRNTSLRAAGRNIVDHNCNSTLAFLEVSCFFITCKWVRVVNTWCWCWFRWSCVFRCRDAACQSTHHCKGSQNQC